MPGFLRQSTASQSRALGPFIDDTDFKTAETGLTIANTDIKLVVNGGASANKNSGGGTHRVNGVYGVTFDATDTATVGEVEVSVVVAGALPVFDKFFVVEEAVYDALFVAAAPGYVVDQPVNATKIGGTVQTAGDLFGRVGAATGSPTAQTVTDDLLAILTRLPNALVGGRIDASVGAMAANVLTATAINADAITAAKLAADVTTELQAGLATSSDLATAQADLDDIQTRIPAALVGGRMDSSVGAMAANVMTAAAAAADLTTELQSGLATSAAVATLQTSVDDLPTNAELATALGTADDAVLAQVALVKAVTDKLNTTVESVGSPTDYVFTARALAQAPSGSGLDAAGVRAAIGLASANLDTQLDALPTAAEVTDAVWDEAISGHLGAGTTGLALNDATAAGNPWNSVLEGVLTAGDMLRINTGVAMGKTTVTAPGNGTAHVVYRDASDLSNIVAGDTVGSNRTSVTLTP